MKTPPLAGSLIALGCLVLGAAGCSFESLHHIYPIPFYDTRAKPVWSPLLGKQLPRRIAILPFHCDQKDDPERRQAVLVLRNAFGEALSRLRTYEVVPPAEVDRLLEGAGVATGSLAKQSPESLGRITGADALLYGDIERTANITLYVYSHTVYEGKFRLVDAPSGEPYWEGSLWEGRRAGIIVEAFVVDMFFSQPDNKKLSSAYHRVADAMVAKLLETIPEPTVVRKDAGGDAAPASSAATGGRP